MRVQLVGATVLISVPFFVSSCALGIDGGESPSPAPTVTETVTATPEPEDFEEISDLNVDELQWDELFTDEELQELAEFYLGDELPEGGEQFEEEEALDFSELSVTDRGNVSMPDTITLTDTVTGEPYVEFEAGDVNTDVQCTGSRPRPPENGHFISVDFQVSVESSFRDVRPDGFTLNAHRFDILDSDGGMTNAGATSGASYSCLADSDLLPRETLPGTTSQGAVLIDSEVESGFLIFHERLSGDSYEWEF